MNPNISSQKLCQSLSLAVVVTLFAASQVSVEAATTVKDKVGSYEGTLRANATFTAKGAGRTAGANDYGLDLTRAGGYVSVPNATWLNAGTANDELTVALWIKRYDIANSTTFAISSPSQAMVFRPHAPWSDNSIYFDTSGCCDGTTQRINANLRSEE